LSDYLSFVEKSEGREADADYQRRLWAEREFLWAAFGWMAAGLILTGLVMLAISVLNLLDELGFLFFLFVLLGECGLAALLWFLQKKVQLGKVLVVAVFFLFAVATGISFYIIFFFFGLHLRLLAVGAAFALMSSYGFSSKPKHGKVTWIVLTGLLAAILGSVVNLFWAGGMIGWVATYLVVGLFILLLIYDYKEISRVAEKGYRPVHGAFKMYLDMIIGIFRFVAEIVSGITKGVSD
jgi:FtsH-binding integral membrane protein